VTKQTDEAGIITYTYDANGNVLTVSEVPKASEKEQSTEDGEDSENSQSSVSANTITRTYDALNRVKTYTDAKGNTIGYAYDEFGNLTKLTYPNGKTVTYTFPGITSLFEETVDIDFEHDGESNKVAKFVYDVVWDLL